MTKKMIAVTPETHEKLQALKNTCRPEGIYTIGGVVDSLVNKAYMSEVRDAESRK